MASIVQRGARFYVVYRCKNDEGIVKQKWETFKNEPDALLRKREVEYCLNRGFLPPANICTVKKLLDTFVDNYGVFTWAMSTYETKRSTIKNHMVPYIGKWFLDSVDNRNMV